MGVKSKKSSKISGIQNVPPIEWQACTTYCICWSCWAWIKSNREGEGGRTRWKKLEAKKKIKSGWWWERQKGGQNSSITVLNRNQLRSAANSHSISYFSIQAALTTSWEKDSQSNWCEEAYKIAVCTYYSDRMEKDLRLPKLNSSRFYLFRCVWSKKRAKFQSWFISWLVRVSVVMLIVIKSWFNRDWFNHYGRLTLFILEISFPNKLIIPD